MSLNNEVRLMGNIVKEPKVFSSDNGDFAIIRLASNTKRGDKEESLFIDVKVFGYAYKDFEYHEIEKGDRVVVYGRLSVEEYTDKNEIKRKEPVIWANSLLKVARKANASKSF